MLNHCGGRKKKAGTFNWAKLISLLPPDSTKLIKIETLVPIDNKTILSKETTQEKPEDEGIIKSEDNKISKKNKSPIATHDNRSKKINRDTSIKQKTGKNTSSISITSMLENNEKEDVVEKKEDISNKPVDKFAFDDLMDKWNHYATKIKNGGKTNLHATITSHLPELKPDFLIELKINNTVQEELLQGEKLNFLNYLREELNNYQIQLKTVLITDDTSSNLYTTRDKYKKLAEKNPALNKLKDLLKLDLDY